MEAKKPRQALGRGLSALVSAAPQINKTEVPWNAVEHSKGPADAANSVNQIEIESIRTNPTQPRQEFNQAELAELSESIRTKGVLQPILVRPIKKTDSGQSFEVVAGERRWRASKLAGLRTIPALIKELTDRETLEIAIVENIQRAQLSPIEEAQAYQRLISEFGLSQVEVAERVGKERATVANFLRLLKLPNEVIELIKAGSLSMGHAKVLLGIKEPSAQTSLARKTIKESLSVRALEAIVARVVVLDAGKRPATQQSTETSDKTAELAFPAVVDKIRNMLGTKVLIKHHASGRGRIEIEYFSESELDRIVEQICR